MDLLEELNEEEKRLEKELRNKNLIEKKKERINNINAKLLNDDKKNFKRNIIIKVVIVVVFILSVFMKWFILSSIAGIFIYFDLIHPFIRGKDGKKGR